MHIIVTTFENSTNTELMLHFRPNSGFIDEAAYDFEFNVILPIFNFDSVTQGNIFGDYKQLGPTIKNPKSEVVHQARYTLQERMINCGMERVLLKRRYRMTLDNADLISKLFYDDEMSTAPNRVVDTRTLEITSYMKKYLASEDWYGRPGSLEHEKSGFDGKFSETCFIDIGYSLALSDEHYPSMANYVEANATVDIVLDLIQSRQGLKSHEIAIISTHEAHLDHIRRELNAIADNALDKNEASNLGEVRLTTVDAAKGKEYPFVILNLVETGNDICASGDKRTIEYAGSSTLSWSKVNSRMAQHCLLLWSGRSLHRRQLEAAPQVVEEHDRQGRDSGGQQDGGSA